MSDKKISQLTAAATPLAGTEVLPIVQSGSTVKVAADDLTVKNLRSNATTGILQVAGPGAGATRVMTVPNANFTAARTDAVQSFTGDQTLATGNLVVGTSGKGLADSAGNLKLGVTTTSVAASSVLSGGLTHRKGVYSASATTPSVAGVSYLDIANASATSITNFTGAVEGQMLLMVFRDANTTITRNNAYLAGSANFTSANNATLLLVSDGTAWYEVCRSTTNG